MGPAGHLEQAETQARAEPAGIAVPAEQVGPEVQVVAELDHQTALRR